MAGEERADGTDGARPALTLAMVQEAAARLAGLPPDEYFLPELGGTVTLRRLTAAEVRACGKLATPAPRQGVPQDMDNDKLNFLLVNRASVAPKVTQEFWDAMQLCAAPVMANLVFKVRELAGLTEEAMTEAGKSSTPTPS